MDDSKSIYKSGEYTENNPDYHSEDSPWKWKNFKKVLENNQEEINISQINSIAEVGCGVGQILKNAKESKIFNNNTVYEGWDINPDAIDFAKKSIPEISFFNDDIFEKNKKFDLIICADVFEHVDDYYGFLKKLSKITKYVVFNIPLDIHLLSMIRQDSIYLDTYNKVGHIHHFTKGTALLALRHSGFHIIDYNYAKHRLNRKSLNTRGRFLFPIQKIIDLINEDLASIFFGGSSLVVLAKS